jgi:hypothetical protein
MSGFQQYFDTVIAAYEPRSSPGKASSQQACTAGSARRDIDLHFNVGSSPAILQVFCQFSMVRADESVGHRDSRWFFFVHLILNLS